jgi:hypothetical protein
MPTPLARSGSGAAPAKVLPVSAVKEKAGKAKGVGGASGHTAGPLVPIPVPQAVRTCH